jgi:hypothetical protein
MAVRGERDNWVQYLTRTVAPLMVVFACLLASLTLEGDTVPGETLSASSYLFFYILLCLLFHY